MGYSLGVDLGSTSVTAAVSVAGRTTIVPLGTRSISAPSVVAQQLDGTLTSGDRAELYARLSPDRIARGFRDRIGDPTPIPLGGSGYRAVDLCAAQLRGVVAKVTTERGEPPEIVALGHPAGWEPYRRRLLVESAALAGLSRVITVTRPEAAVAHHIETRTLTRGGTVAIYDLGGRSFEATVLGGGATGGPEILGTERVAGLGGAAFDEAILRYVRDCAEPIPTGLDDREAATLLEWLRRDCAAAKERLSHRTGTAVPVRWAALAVPLDRVTFEDLIRAQVTATIDVLHRTVHVTGLHPGELRAVLLSGGSSTIPLIRRLVALHTGRPVLATNELMSTIACGAAALGAAHLAAGPVPAVPRHTALTPAGTDELRADDDVQFTVYRPRAVRPQRWHTLLAYAYRSTPFVDEDGIEVDPVLEVREQAQGLLGAGFPDYGAVVTDSTRHLPRGNEIVFEPWIEEGEFNPVRVAVRWEEPVHRADFRFRVGAGVDGRRLRGGMRVYLGVLLIGELRYQVAVDENTTRAEHDPGEPVPGRPYRRIFASYSHRDTEIVSLIRAGAMVLGDRYLIDVESLRAGEHWDARLREMIGQADVFQLFWSHNAMNSRHVQSEWRHALSLDRAHFIRPVYWEDPRPSDPTRDLPPAALSRLHFSRLTTPGQPGTTRPSALNGYVAGAASGSSPPPLVPPRSPGHGQPGGLAAPTHPPPSRAGRSGTARVGHRSIPRRRRSHTVLIGASVLAWLALVGLGGLLTDEVRDTPPIAAPGEPISSEGRQPAPTPAPGGDGGRSGSAPGTTPSGPQLTLRPDRVAVGGVYQLAVSGFLPGEFIQLSGHGSPDDPADRLTADADGTASVTQTARVPGTYLVTATGLSSRRNAGARIQVARPGDGN